MHRILDHARRNVVAYLALFVALGGTAYAATQLPANSVGAKQIRNHVIGPVKLSPKIAGTVRHWARVSAAAKPKVLASSGGAHVVRDPWPVVSWGDKFSSRCVPLVTLEFDPAANVTGGTNGFATAGLNSDGKSRSVKSVSVRTYNAKGHLNEQPFYITLICP